MLNFRKIILYILSVSVLFNMCFPCFVRAGEDFYTDSFEIRNARVIISGKTKSSGDTVTLAVKNKLTQNIFLLDETVSGSDKSFSFDLKMPDEMKGSTAEGVFFVTIASNDVIITGEKYEFEFAGSMAREKFVEQVKKNPENLRQMIENSENSVVVKTIGIAKDDYTNLSSDGQKDGVVSFFIRNADIENLTEETLCSEFNTAVYAMYIKNSNAAYALGKLNYSYDGKTFSQLTDVNMKNYIINSVNSKSYENGAEINADYRFYYSVYELNNAKATEMSDILEKHKAALGIDDSSEYKNFASLNGEALTKAERELAVTIEKGALTTTEKIKNALSLAYDAATYVSPSTPSGGGSSKGGGGSTVSFNPSVNNDKNDKNDTDSVRKEDKFSDLQSVLWAKDAIEKLADKNIVSGVGDGIFSPDTFVKREEFIKMLVLALGVYDENAVCAFDDTNASDWHYKYIASAVKNGIVLGKTNSTFGTGEYLTREDVAVMLSRCATAAEDKDIDFAFADDENIANYAKDAVYKLYANGIINGVGENLFAPKEPCTRAMAAKLVYSAIFENAGGDK